MSQLIILNGASGAGKTFSMEEMPKVDEAIVPIKKFTTRGPRSYEEGTQPVDLVFDVDEKEILACKYHYEYVDNLYGIDARLIDEALGAKKIPIVIVRDYETIITLKHDYPGALAFYIHSAYTGEELKKILKAQGRKDIDIRKRKNREKGNFSDYIEYLEHDLFEHYIFNYYDENLIIQMKYFLSKHLRRDNR